MVAASPSVAYIHEPFSPNHNKKRASAPFINWFTYVNEENGEDYYPYMKDIVEFRNHFWYRLFRARPLLKDPIALFSAEWLFSRFDMDVVVTIRHPAAFAASLKEKNWSHPFLHFMNQPALMHKHLQPFEKKIAEFAKEEKNIIDQAALLWNLVHYMILKYKKSQPDWIYVRHEDLSRDPQGEFRSLFNQLNLDFTEKISRTIKQYSTNSDSIPASEMKDLKRDSLANLYSWKAKLSAAEIEQIRSQVQNISKEYYSDDEW